LRTIKRVRKIFFILLCDDVMEKQGVGRAGKSRVFAAVYRCTESPIEAFNLVGKNDAAKL